LSQTFSAFARVPAASHPAIGSLKMFHSLRSVAIKTSHCYKHKTFPDGYRLCVVKSAATDTTDGATVLRSACVVGRVGAEHYVVMSRAEVEIHPV